MIERISKPGLTEPVGSAPTIRPDMDPRSKAGSKPAARRSFLIKKPKEEPQEDLNEEPKENRRPKRPGRVDEYA